MSILNLLIPKRTIKLRVGLDNGDLNLHPYLSRIIDNIPKAGLIESLIYSQLYYPCIREKIEVVYINPYK